MNALHHVRIYFFLTHSLKNLILRRSYHSFVKPKKKKVNGRGSKKLLFFALLVWVNPKALIMTSYDLMASKPVTNQPPSNTLL